jgi:hypothetical protein
MDEQSLRPWNWCDRRCERCPLALECTVNLRVEEQKRQLLERGADPDDPNAMLVVVAESLREAVQLVTAGVEPPEEEELETAELYEAALRYARAVDDLCEEGEDALVDEVRLITVILVAKTARLIDALPLQRHAIARDDTVLTLLLISQLEKQAAALAMAVGAEWQVSHMMGYRRARRDLRRVLDVHLEAIGRSEREAVERMVAAGRAPSPFCLALGPPLTAA